MNCLEPIERKLYEETHLPLGGLLVSDWVSSSYKFLFFIKMFNIFLCGSSLEASPRSSALKLVYFCWLAPPGQGRELLL